MHSATPTTPPASDPVIIFDRPPSRPMHFCLTVGLPYQTRPVDLDLRLYEITDDRAQQMLVSLYGRPYTNGGYWHLQGEVAHPHA